MNGNGRFTMQTMGAMQNQGKVIPFAVMRIDPGNMAKMSLTHQTIKEKIFSFIRETNRRYSYRGIAKALGVSPTTVRCAVSSLVKEGRIQRKNSSQKYGRTRLEVIAN